MRFLLLCLIAFACPAHADVIQLSGDTYMVVRSSKGGIFANMSKLKVAAIQEANAFAARHGKIAVPYGSTTERPAGGPGQWPTVEYQFRLVDKDSPASQGVGLKERADVVVESTNHTSADIRTTEEKKPDLYTELTKIDELRKRGLLTDAEFEEQKKRLLEKTRE
jgi:hypothetical protein